MLIETIMTRRVAALGPKDALARAARLMQAEEVGCVLVLAPDRKPLGVLTDRDLVVRAVAAGRSPEEVRLEEAMSRNPITVTRSEQVLVAARRMADHQVRRLPVVVDEEGRVVGLRSVHDLLTVFITELSNVAAAIAGASRLVK